MDKAQFILFDGDERDTLLPFTFIRSVADIRIGILRIREKWEIALESKCGVLTQKYLQELYSVPYSDNPVYINAAILPDNKITDAVQSLRTGEILYSQEGDILALKPESIVENPNNLKAFSDKLKKVIYAHKSISLKYPWDIFTYNATQIQADIKALRLEPNGHIFERDNKVSHPENIYAEEGASVQWAMLNAEKGPIYLGKDSLVMEGAILKENFALGAHSTVKMGAKMYGDTTVGPHSKVGGEIGNCVIFGYSNKGHDGYLGNSVLGEWCNLGADTNNSNLKNNYGTVKSWSYKERSQVSTGLQFCGLMMGDHSKSGINTMFNTGTVVGVFANIFGGDFPPKFIPSFSWGGNTGLIPYDFDKAVETAKRVMSRRHMELSDTEREILHKVYNDTAVYRNLGT